jgi:CRISPR-associated protein Csx10
MIVRYHPFTLTLGSPVVLTSAGGDPNSAETTDFISGSAIRGAAARALTDAAPDFHRLILSGEVLYLNAYVLLGNQRCLPAPASLRREKYAHSVCHDLAGYSGGRSDEEDERDWPNEQLARLPSRYLTLTEPTPRAGVVRERGCVHHQRDRGIGKPTERTGALFRFEALEEGQRFGGLVVYRGADEDTVERLADRVRGALGETVLLGRSRRAGYGGSARLEWGQARSREVEGQAVASGAQPAGAFLRALLVSDYVGRDTETGQADPSAWLDEIVRRLGGRVETLRWFGEAVLVGGYNRKWGMELPQALAQRAGAVAVFRVTAPILEEELLALEHQGLGERRIEGFGRVVFLRGAVKKPSLGGAPPRERVARPQGEPPPELREMERRLLRDAVDASALEVAGELAGSAQRVPTRSLLGRLRVPLRLAPALGLAQLRQWLGNGANALRRPALRQLERCRIQPRQSQRRPLADWLRELLGGQTDLGTLLNYPRLAQDHHFISNDSALECLTVPEEGDRVRTLFIDALLAAMARRRDPDSGGRP